MIKFILSFYFVFLIPFCFIAQNAIQVNGIITDSKTKLPIENVHVKVHHQNNISRTNSKGEFNIRFQQQKLTTLVISHTSYNTVYEVINNNEDSIFLTVQLTEKVVSLPVAEITDKSAPVPRSEEHTSELQSRENLVCRLLLEKKKL